jgi:hypothetical protein
MQRKICVAALGLLFGMAAPAGAQIIKGNLIIRGAEMS